MNKTKYPATWPIDIKSLDGYKKPTWDEEDFHEVPQSNYAICFYNIVEERMMWYFSCFAIFEDKSNPHVIINSANIRIHHNFSRPFFFLRESNCFFFVSIFNNKEKTDDNYPFLVINPAEQKFTFINIGFTSLYYRIESGKEKNEIRIVPDNVKELERFQQAISVKTYHLELLRWFDLKDLHSAKELFFLYRKEF